MMKLEELVDKLQTQHLLVVGDAITDTYVFGRVDRICPEAPAPVFIAESIEERAGGADHTTEQVKALGVGSGVFGWPISNKFRYMAGHHLLLRIDRDEKPCPTTEMVIKVFEENVVDEHPIHGVILSDYGKGFLDEQMCQYFIKFAAARGAKVFVDPKGSDWSKYRGADWICPNEKEFSEMTNPVSFWSGQVLRKRGAKGLQIGDVEFPSVARAVFDVTGAGDTVVAVFAMSICAGADPGTAAQLANIAAGATCGQIGTVSIGHEELKALAKFHDDRIAARASESRRRMN